MTNCLKGLTMEPNYWYVITLCIVVAFTLCAIIAL